MKAKVSNIKINDWLKTETFRIADRLIEINDMEVSDHHISGFGMKNKVYDLLTYLKGALYPYIYENNDTDIQFLEAAINKKVTDSAMLLNYILMQVYFSVCAEERKHTEDCTHCAEKADKITMEFIDHLPALREVLSTDVAAAVRGDPAALSYEDVIISYPCVEAITIYRLAHELFIRDVPLIPRIMTEYAHSQTGIDIHPGAKIGKYFFIDHGTGVVIGETCTIGNNVKLYQGVTLGARSFDMDENGELLRTKRHPDIEDNVIIYAGATILGGDTCVGHDSIIGGNVWLTKSVHPYSKVYNSTPQPTVKAEDY